LWVRRGSKVQTAAPGQVKINPGLSLTSETLSRYQTWGSATPHRSPGDATRGLPFPPARRPAEGPAAGLRHTPAMRQWACVVALLLGLAGNGYVATTRIRLPIAIERRLEPTTTGRRTTRTLDWWRA
jgi:hypothetical protein